MRKIFVILSLLFATLTASAQDRRIDIEGVTVTGNRPIKDIGVQQTKIDSVSLKENIALSMADVLTFNSPIFVKNYGRATLSTVSFRGTSPSHTQVTWNGMRINNPMLGMTDFSMIPSHFIDNATLLHGTSSVNSTGGGLGGAVQLATRPAEEEGFKLQYVQGVGSFLTFDEYLQLNYGRRGWQAATRVSYSSSPNEYKYINRDKKENIYDEDMNIIDQYYPEEINRSGSYKDLHILQEVYYKNNSGDRFGLNVWYINSNRELAMLTTDYADDTDFDNRQREQTVRSVLSWDHLRSTWKSSARAGYIYTWMAYDSQRAVSEDIMAVMSRSRSQINTIYGEANGEYSLGRKWLFTASLSAHQHFVLSKDKNIILQDGGKGIVGYDQARIELSGSVSAKWRPTDRFGVSAVLREELFGRTWTPLIPALFIDYVISKTGNVILKASGSRNYRFPTLNDLYFLPGGNPDLRHESGWSYDAGVSFEVGSEGKYKLNGSATWFDSYINDWIIWLPTTKGFFSPENVKDVHAYGVEVDGHLSANLAKDWLLNMDATFSWTPSINHGEKRSPADQSIGKQLPYIPKLSSTVSGRLTWREWSFVYNWCFYSERYTMSSNDISLTGKLPKYYMSNISLGYNLALRWADFNLKGTINNLFDEEYLSVLSRPMPGINFEIFIGITPKW